MSANTDARPQGTAPESQILLPYALWRHSRDGACLVLLQHFDHSRAGDPVEGAYFQATVLPMQAGWAHVYCARVWSGHVLARFSSQPSAAMLDAVATDFAVRVEAPFCLDLSGRWVADPEFARGSTGAAVAPGAVSGAGVAVDDPDDNALLADPDAVFVGADGATVPDDGAMAPDDDAAEGGA